MDEISIESAPDDARLEELGVWDWDVWSREVASFPWHYDRAETCYLLEGEVVVTPDGGEPVRIVAGDLVTFPAGMSCNWEIRADIRKHYRFD